MARRERKPDGMIVVLEGAGDCSPQVMPGRLWHSGLGLGPAAPLPLHGEVRPSQYIFEHVVSEQKKLFSSKPVNFFIVCDVSIGVLFLQH